MQRATIAIDFGKCDVPAFGTGARTEYEREATVDTVFSQRAAESPAAIAVRSDEECLSYAELETASNRVASYLRSAGLRPGSTAGVALERCAQLPAVLLGILKGGAAYVPLDPSYPADRLTFMASDAAVTLVVTDRRRGPLAAFTVPQVDVTAALGAPDDRRPAPAAGPESLAYIIYTSGSTGRPKGVAVEHRNVLRLVRGSDYVSVLTGDVFLQFAPLAFDASTFELWAPLLNGASLAVPKPGLFTMEELAEIVDHFGVTTLWLTAPVFARLVDAPAARPRSLQTLLTGGDVVSPHHARRFFEAFPHCRLINGYGPTENTTFSCCYVMTSAADVGESVPIGRPIANSSAYVVDADLTPVGIGETGELCVGGDGVARGYVNLPELTAERFVRDPIAGDGVARLYRTGDRARWRADGVLEFLGRLDDQVKVRGFRIELGEIEAALARHDGVNKAVVVVAPRNDEKEIVAYVVARGGTRLDESELRAHLARTLPSYMLPHRIVLRSELPLHPSGKVDRVALAQAPAPPRLVRNAAPSAALEQMITEVWAEVLGPAWHPALDENFFDAGGDSLLLLTVHTRLRARLNAEVTITDLFEQTTIRKLAAFVTRAQAAS